MATVGTFEIEEAATTHRVTNYRRRRRSLLLLVCIPMIAVFVILKVVMHNGDLEIKTLRVEDFKPGLNVYNDSISFGANGVGFMATGNIHPVPELAIFSLTMGVIKHHPIMLLSNTTFKISQDKQLLHIIFEPQLITLPEEEISLFRQRLQHAGIWLKLDGEFGWHPEKEPSVVIRDERMHIRFRCAIHYKVAPIDKIHLKECILYS